MFNLILPALLFVASLLVLLAILRRTGLGWRWNGALALLAAGGWLVSAFYATSGLAQAANSSGVTIDQWYAYVCGNDGAVFKFLANYLMYPAFGAILVTWSANSKTIQALPLVGPLVRLVGGHWAGWLREAAANHIALAVSIICLGLALSACTASQIVTAADAVQAACKEADKAADAAQSQLKGGALDTANDIIVYEKSVCVSADKVAAAAANPSTAAWLGAMSQQLKGLVGG